MIRGIILVDGVIPDTYGQMKCDGYLALSTNDVKNNNKGNTVRMSNGRISTKGTNSHASHLTPKSKTQRRKK